MVQNHVILLNGINDHHQIVSFNKSSDSFDLPICFVDSKNQSKNNKSNLDSSSSSEPDSPSSYKFTKNYSIDRGRLYGS